MERGWSYRPLDYRPDPLGRIGFGTWPPSAVARERAVGDAEALREAW